MLSFLGGTPVQGCDGATRRNFLKVGALGLGGLTLPSLLRARAAERDSKDTAVVLLFLPGGPSHLDTYDMKPSAPAEFRGLFKPIRTSVPGIDICELMPRQARIMDKLSLVRTFSHADGNHGSAAHWVMTGVIYPPADLGEPQIAPSPGSVAARVRGVNPRTGMVPYVALSRIRKGEGGDGPAYLGVGCAPLDPSGPAKRNMSLAKTMSLDQLRDRRGLLASLDMLRRDIDRSGTMSGLDEFEQQAYQLILGQGAQALDLTREDPRIVDRYGPGLGEQMLVARRLCEAGAAFVNIAWHGPDNRFFGWDNRSRVFESLRSKLPILDRAVSAFVEDVARRGLSERILLVVFGEMGRTPKINPNAGRDHWPQVMFALLSGGGLKMGQVVGKSSARGETCLIQPFGAQDLLATIYHVLRINPKLQFNNTSGRPLPILSDGRPISDLL